MRARVAGVGLLLFRTSLSSGSATPGVSDAGSVLSRAGAHEGQPFILAADGSYDAALNRFLRELPSWGMRSRQSIDAYARDLLVFCRFLHESRGGRTIWQADGADLRAFKAARRRVDGFQVAASTWNRFLAALEKWAHWAVAERLIQQSPFRRVERTVITPQGRAVVSMNAERERDDRPASVSFLPYDEYMVWRDVGLRGHLPAGGPDPAWRGRHGARNALFADLLVGTGMRLSEASSLLVNEIPPLVEGRMNGDLHLAAAVCKGSRARTVFLSRRVLRDVHHYLRIERSQLVARRRAGAGYNDVDAVAVISAGRHSVSVAGRRPVPCSRIPATERARLIGCDGNGQDGPLWLWLGEDGTPLDRSGWQAAFRAANARCARFGLDLVVHPHLLRHTFAVHMLGLLLRQTVRALRVEPGQTVTGHQVKRLLVGDPLRKLQLLLGHRHVETTFGYLDMLDEAQEIVLTALAEWDDQAAALTDAKW